MTAGPLARAKRAVAVLALLAAAPALAPGAPAAAQALVALDDMPRAHRIVVDAASAGRLLVATQGGLYDAMADGIAAPLGSFRGDLIGLAALPGGRLYAGGRSPTGRNLGLLVSTDGGESWTPRDADKAQAAAFYALAASPADPDRVYGLGLKRGFLASRDGGRSWSAPGKPPGPVYDIAVSPRDPARVYAATRVGLKVSRDGGKTWSDAYPRPNPSTTVDVAPDGRVFAFVWRVGLVTAKEGDGAAALSWTVAAADFLDRLLVDLAADPARPRWIYGLADTGALMASDDGGRSWTTFEGSGEGRKAAIARGEVLYRDTCQACHGERGVGERPDDMYAKDEFGFVAPPLDDSAHGWHHSDSGLVATILNGSPRNERMRGWKGEMTEAQARDIVAYIKSLWNFRSLACQGPRHMICTQQQQQRQQQQQ